VRIRKLHRAVALLGVLVLCQAASADGWQVLKGKHFLVHFVKDKAFAQKTLNEAEKYYVTITKGLGYPKHDNFWQWENRVKIYIYESRAEFRKATGAPDWAAGKANHNKKEVAGVQDARGFLAGVLPHELTHLIFRDIVGFGDDIPLWLNEGVAMWYEKGRRTPATLSVRSLLKSKKHLPLKALVLMDIRTSHNKALAGRYYDECITVVGYLLEEGGPDRFRKFCRCLRGGMTLDEALRSSYPGIIRNVGELDKAWQEHVLNLEKLPDEP
jgi:hypothetical protein